jgi:hypothetical protein
MEVKSKMNSSRRLRSALLDSRSEGLRDGLIVEGANENNRFRR